MITVVSATARPDSMTQQVSNYYSSILAESNVSFQEFSLAGLTYWHREPGFLDAETRLIIPATKFIFVMPEYNGSFPGSIKSFIDNSDIKACWWGKKALLTGISDGRAGNLRGLEHMTAVLHYLRVDVHYNKLPISRIREEFDPQGRILKPATEEAIRLQVEQFIAY